MGAIGAVVSVGWPKRPSAGTVGELSLLQARVYRLRGSIEGGDGIGRGLAAEEVLADAAQALVAGVDGVVLPAASFAIVGHGDVAPVDVVAGGVVGGGGGIARHFTGEIVCVCLCVFCYDAAKLKAGDFRSHGVAGRQSRSL